MTIGYSVKSIRPLSDGKMGASKERAARIKLVREVLAKLNIRG